MNILLQTQGNQPDMRTVYSQDSVISLATASKRTEKKNERNNCKQEMLSQCIILLGDDVRTELGQSLTV